MQWKTECSVAVGLTCHRGLRSSTREPAASRPSQPGLGTRSTCKGVSQSCKHTRQTDRNDITPPMGQALPGCGSLHHTAALNLEVDAEYATVHESACCRLFISAGPPPWISSQDDTGARRLGELRPLLWALCTVQGLVPASSAPWPPIKPPAQLLHPFPVQKVLLAPAVGDDATALQQQSM